MRRSGRCSPPLVAGPSPSRSSSRRSLREDGARRGLSLRVLEVLVRRGLLDDGGLRGVPRTGRGRASTTRPCCPTRTGSSPGSAAPATGGRGDPRLRGLRRRRADRPRHDDPRPPPGRATRRAVRAEPPGRGPRPVAPGDRRRPRASGCTVIVTVDCGSTSHAEIAVAVERGHRCPRHRPPPDARRRRRRPARSSTRTVPTARYPDRRLTGSGVAFKVAQLVLADDHRAARRRPSTSPTSRSSAPSRTWRRSSARTGRSRGSASTGCAPAARPGLAALLARAGVAPATVDLETVVVRRSPRGSMPPDGWATRPTRRRLLARGRRRDGDRPGRSARGGQPRPAGR